MHRKITDIWKNLLGPSSQPEANDQEAADHELQEDALDEEQVMLELKHVSWTRVVALREFKDGDCRNFELAKDMIDSFHQLDEIDEEALPQLGVHFDPIKWQETNQQYHLCVYKLNEDQLKMWGEEVTEIRQKIMKKAHLYDHYAKKSPAQPEPMTGKRAQTYSTKRCNPDGLLEQQIRQREQSQAGVKSRQKKRSLKELPVKVREGIVKMYLEDNIFQVDIAKYYKISPQLVSKLIKEAQEDPAKNLALKRKKEEQMERSKAVQDVVKGMLANSVPIVKAEMVATQVMEVHHINVSIQQVRDIMREELGLGYRLSKKVPIQGNSERCLVLR